MADKYDLVIIGFGALLLGGYMVNERMVGF